MKKNSIGIMALFFLISCGNKTIPEYPGFKLEKAILNKINSSGNVNILLSDITPFKWDQFIDIPRDVDLADVRKLGYDIPNYETKANIWAFFLNKRLVHCEICDWQSESELPETRNVFFYNNNKLLVLLNDSKILSVKSYKHKENRMIYFVAPEGVQIPY